MLLRKFKHAKYAYTVKVNEDTLALLDVILNSEPVYRPPYFLVNFPEPGRTYTFDLDELNKMLEPYDLEYVPDTELKDFIVLRQLSTLKKKLRSLISWKK